MPAYNYFPATYQPFYQPTQFNTYPTQQNVAPTQPTQNNIIWVNSDSDAEMYPIAPNNAVTLWHRTAPIVYFKQADASGRTSMKVYDLVEHKSQNDEQVEYATKGDLTQVEALINAVKNDLKAIKRELKRKEAVEDDDE